MSQVDRRDQDVEMLPLMTAACNPVRSRSNSVTSQRRQQTSTASHWLTSAAHLLWQRCTNDKKMALGALAFIMAFLVMSVVFLPPLVRSVADAQPAYDDASIYMVQSVTTGAGGVVAAMRLKRGVYPKLGDDYEQLTTTVEYQTDSRLRVHIAPTGIKRWEIPNGTLPRQPQPLGPHLPASTLYVPSVLPKPGQAFSLTIRRKGATGTAHTPALGPPLFFADGVTFKDQFISVATSLLAETCLYGLGEITAPANPLRVRGAGKCGSLQLPRDGRLYALWAADTPPDQRGRNLYGAHPFYLEVRPDGTAHGVLLLSSNAMDVKLEARRLTFRPVGGLLDLYFFLGPTPEAVIRQYHELVGKAALPPRWALGVQQTRWGYRNVADLQAVVNGYAAAELPLETVYSDIDYMDQARDFALDPVNYPADQLATFVKGLHAAGQRWVPIVDAGVVKLQGDPAYDSGMAADVFVKDAGGIAPYMGQVWCGPAVWPDFFHPNASAWWSGHLAALHRLVPFDGIWLDMNEVSNFCSVVEGQVCTGDSDFWAQGLNGTTDCHLQCSDSLPVGGVVGGAELYRRLLAPPYAINNNGSRLALSHKTLPVTAVQWGGVHVYDSHNLYGLSQSQATAHGLLGVNKGKRPFILSRATFPGSGQYAAHWTGDNQASWESLQSAVQGVLYSNMWGIPLAGADICGFFGSATPELCARWASAGAFYTLARNHQGHSQPLHEFFRWAVVQEAARKAFGMRYRMLPYLYTQLYVVHKLGGTLARPLFFSFPHDSEAREASGTQWLLGESILVSPVMQEGATQVQAYFPHGRWYSLWDYTYTDGPASLTLPALLGDVPVHLRGGCILPMQRSKLTTSATAKTPLTLVVGLGGGPIPSTVRHLAPWAEMLPLLAPTNTSGQGGVLRGGTLHACNSSLPRSAIGVLYLDDGESIDSASNSFLAVVTACASAVPVARLSRRSSSATGKASSSATSEGWLRFSIASSTLSEELAALAVERVDILGLVTPVSAMGQQVLVASAALEGKQIPKGLVQYNATCQVLSITLEGLTIARGFEVHWHLAWGSQ